MHACVCQWRAVRPPCVLACTRAVKPHIYDLQLNPFTNAIHFVHLAIPTVYLAAI